MVCSQALFNLLGAERYANVADQVIRYALGRFGRPTLPLDPNVLDRVMSHARAREIEREGPMPDLPDLRRRFAPGISDEEFLLRATMPAQQVDGMLAAGPAQRHYNPAARPMLKLLKELAARPALSGLEFEKPGFRLRLRRRAPASQGAA
jgi:oxaloacetate decarboxylase alpha subunit